ncbi:hypothetical protein T439DRAFT_33665 [Meredithblackwellia eburnea MCA 4105]
MSFLLDDPRRKPSSVISSYATPIGHSTVKKNVRRLSMMTYDREGPGSDGQRHKTHAQAVGFNNDGIDADINLFRKPNGKKSAVIKKKITHKKFHNFTGSDRIVPDLVRPDDDDSTDQDDSYPGPYGNGDDQTDSDDDDAAPPLIRRAPSFSSLPSFPAAGRFDGDDDDASEDDAPIRALRTSPFGGAGDEDKPKPPKHLRIFIIHSPGAIRRASQQPEDPHVPFLCPTLLNAGVNRCPFTGLSVPGPHPLAGSVAMPLMEMLKDHGFPRELKQIHLCISIKVVKTVIRISGLNIPSINVLCHNPPDEQSLPNDCLGLRHKWTPLGGHKFVIEIQKTAIEVKFSIVSKPAPAPELPSFGMF